MATERTFTQDWLTDVFRQVPAFVAILRGPEHVFEMVNPAYYRLVGHRELIGRSVREVFPDADIQNYIALLDQVYRTGDPYVGEEQAIPLQVERHGPTEKRYLNFVYNAISHPGEGVTGIIVLGVDVTDLVLARQKAEEQAVALEAQAEELQYQATQLEEAQAELEASNEELVHANREAEQARARLEAVIEQMPSGVIVADAPSGRRVLGNRQVEKIWRRPFQAHEAVGVIQYAAFHPDGRPYEQGEWPLERALHGEEVLDEEIAIVRADGSRGVISVSSAPIRDRQGDVVAAVAVFDDISEAWQQEAEQRFLVEVARILASSLDYRETLKSVAQLSVPHIADWCAVDVLDEGRVQRLAVVHHDPEKAPIAHEIARRWPPDPHAAVGVPHVLRSGEPALFREITDDLLRSVSRDEEHLRMLRAVGMRSAMILPMIARGRPLGAISFVAAESGRQYGPADIRSAEKLATRAAMAVDNARLFSSAESARNEAEAAQRKAEEARRMAEGANRAKSEFLANMSHEIRTPLNAVTGYTELLEMEIGGPLTEQQRAHLSRIRKSTGHLLGLVNDLLDLARVESGRLEVQHEAAQAAQAVEAALALLRPQAVERQVDLDSHCAGEDAVYIGDEDRVRQILVNIIGNAVKFTDSGGRVTVACGGAEDAESGALHGEPGPWTWIRVTDSGIGIAPDQLERIFRPFEQAQGGYTREMGGAGLGLSISRQLALLMGGDITATSQPGEGSVFTLWLPRKAPADLVPDEAAFGDERPRGLTELSETMLAEVDEILDRYSARLREDPLLPMAARLENAELKDHQSSLLSDIAAALAVLDHASGAQAQLLRDGSEIQRLVADLHGRQRAQLSWTESALQREFEILRSEVREVLLRAVPPVHASADVEGGLRLILRLLERAERISLRTFRVAIGGTRAVQP